MSIYKCRMCEKEFETENIQSVCNCSFCGTSQTLPLSDNDRIISAMNRANHLRQTCEFNKAETLYSELLNHTKDDPEIYWQLALCRYGVQYIKEPQINLMVPDCRRARYKSILCDDFFLKAIDTMDMPRRNAYRKEAEYIDVMQKKMLDQIAVQKPEKNIPDEEELTAEDLVRRGNLCLEKRKWASAYKFFTRAVSISPQNPDAFLGRLLVECELENDEKIPDVTYDLSFSSNYHKAIQLGCTRLEDLSRQSMLNRGIKLMKSAHTLSELTSARLLLSNAGNIQNAEAMLSECCMKIEELKEQNYQKACQIMAESISLEETEAARIIFEELENYKDSPIKVQECGELLLHNDYERENSYRKGLKLLKSAEFHSDYDTAAEIFKSLEDYKDSSAMLKKCIRKHRFLSFSLVIKLGFIAGLCYIVPVIIDKI